MDCKLKRNFKYLIVNEENAAEILDIIGFGAYRCEITAPHDKRYGYYSAGLYYGFKGSMEAFIPNGRYFVYEYYINGDPYEFFSAREFAEEFEIISGNL